MTFVEFKAINGGAHGMVLNKTEQAQRTAATNAYLDALPKTDSRILRWDKAIEYANFQIARQRGWAHLHQFNPNSYANREFKLTYA